MRKGEGGRGEVGKEEGRDRSKWGRRKEEKGVSGEESKGKKGRGKRGKKDRRERKRRE